MCWYDESRTNCYATSQGIPRGIPGEVPYEFSMFFCPKLLPKASKWPPGESKWRLERSKSTLWLIVVSKTAADQWCSPILIDFWWIWGSILEPILDKKSFKNHMFFWSCFLQAFGPLFVDFLVFFEAFGRPKITLKTFAMRSCEKRKNIKKRHRVASKSRFAGSEVHEQISLRSMLRHEKNTCCANERKSQICHRFGLHLGFMLGTKIDAKSYQKMNRKSIPQKIDKKRALKSNSHFWETHTELQGPLGRGGDVNTPTSKTQHLTYSRSNTPLGQRPGEFSKI